MESESSRRKFVSAVPAAAATFLIVKPEQVRGSQANSSLTVGLIGAGRRGTHVGGLFVKNDNAKMVSICDIYDDQLKAALPKFPGAKTFKDYRELLASDVDAVYIATPPYLHPEHFEAAVNARKHIFMEKPAGVDAAGCKKVMAAAKRADKTKRISVDYQQRYGVDYNAAYQIVKSGQLGPIRAVRAAWIGGGLPVRKGHAEAEEKVRNWLFYRELSGDIIVEQNCHNLDVVNWFMGAHPLKASGYGGRAVRKDIGNIMDNLAATFEYPDGTILSYSANQFMTRNFNDVSETFMCDKGAINTSRRGYTLYDSDQRGAAPKVVQSESSKADITKDAVDQFIEGARTGKIENAGIYAAESTLTAILAREAIYKKREMTWAELMK